MDKENNIFFDPGSVFQSPEEVLKRRDLNREQKIKILREWEYDIRELTVAEEENMGGARSEELAEMLAQIHRALYYLKVHHNPARTSPTKQGGGSWQ